MSSPSDSQNESASQQPRSPDEHQGERKQVEIDPMSTPLSTTTRRRMAVTPGLVAGAPISIEPIESDLTTSIEQLMTPSQTGRISATISPVQEELVALA